MQALLLRITSVFSCCISQSITNATHWWVRSWNVLFSFVFWCISVTLFPYYYYLINLWALLFLVISNSGKLIYVFSLAKLKVDIKLNDFIKRVLKTNIKYYKIHSEVLGFCSIKGEVFAKGSPESNVWREWSLWRTTRIVRSSLSSGSPCSPSELLPLPSIEKSVISLGWG